MSMDTYQTIKSVSRGLYKDKGSKFISIAHPIDTEEEASAILSEVKQQYHDARHHCYAWVIGNQQEKHKFNDDGEPSGTAGRPIFGQILSAGLTNVLIIVVRYFGGTKLGVRGLINAYKGAANEAIQNNKIITKTVRDHYRIHFDYLSMNEVMQVLKEHDLPQSAHDFEMRCKLDFSVRKLISKEVLGKLEKINEIEIQYLFTK